MGTEDLFYIFISGLPFGIFAMFIWSQWEKKQIFQKTNLESEHVIQTAKEQAESLITEKKKQFYNSQKNPLQLFEKQKELLNSNLKNLQIKIDKTHHQLKLKKKEKIRNYHQTKNRIYQIKHTKQDYIKQQEQLRKTLKMLTTSQIQKLENHFSINLKQIKEDMKMQTEKTWIKKLNNEWIIKNKQNRQNLQKEAYFYLNIVLNRFDRTYCPERGIGSVICKTKKQLDRLMGPNKIYLHTIEKECGIDILVQPEDRQMFIFGIEPVRRELGRMTLKTCLKKNKLDTDIIQKTVKNCKKKLFSKIRQDGRKICNKLRLKNIAPEVQNMMGALRYRYSFAQNQYFHCEEVGWLCGLLNAELNLPIKLAQRAGMFHDIGKAMDHSIEGSHAVIGADFLSKYNEKEEILHPVRAHHHDETPSTILAYLVIAADAISGARPGARRFTEDSYNQKMANLERIIDSFPNIEDAYIMSAGREMRVIVNNKKISDQEALNLSQKIARKIEKECSYPGLIKITVVRHSEQTAVA